MTHLYHLMKHPWSRTILIFVSLCVLLTLTALCTSSLTHASSHTPTVTLATVTFTYYNPDGSVNTAAITETLTSGTCTTITGAPTEDFTTGIAELATSTEPVKIFDNTTCTGAGLRGVLSPGQVATAYKTSIYAVEVGA